MEAITTKEFREWFNDLVNYEPEKLASLYYIFNVKEIPSPENLMLMAAKYGDAFFDVMKSFSTAPPLMNLDGEGLKGFFSKALSATQGAATALHVFGAVAGATTPSNPLPQYQENIPTKDLDYYTIFGMQVKKMYVWLTGGLGALVAIYLIVKHRKG